MHNNVFLITDFIISCRLPYISVLFRHVPRTAVTMYITEALQQTFLYNYFKICCILTQTLPVLANKDLYEHCQVETAIGLPIMSCMYVFIFQVFFIGASWWLIIKAKT
jgi:hypothetical protein